MSTPRSLIPRPLLNIVPRSAWAYRRATSRRRALPRFLVIGAMKSGTTSLFEHLCRHPHLVAGIRKEVHYFDGGLRPGIDNYAKGPGWYRAHFPMRRRLGNRTLAGEASPFYLFHPLAARRIRRLLPDVKLIAILRNPTERAISHYTHMRRLPGVREPLPLAEALEAEEQRLRPILDRADYGHEAYIHQSYQARGRYREQLDRYLEHFPREQLFITSSEAFFADPDSTLGRLFAFLGVDAAFSVGDVGPMNVAPNRIEVEPGVRAELDDYFRPHNRALRELTGVDFGWPC